MFAIWVATSSGMSLNASARAAAFSGLSPRATTSAPTGPLRQQPGDPDSGEIDAELVVVLELLDREVDLFSDLFGQLVVQRLGGQQALFGGIAVQAVSGREPLLGVLAQGRLDRDLRRRGVGELHRGPQEAGAHHRAGARAPPGAGRPAGPVAVGCGRPEHRRVERDGGVGVGVEPVVPVDGGGRVGDAVQKRPDAFVGRLQRGRRLDHERVDDHGVVGPVRRSVREVVDRVGVARVLGVGEALLRRPALPRRRAGVWRGHGQRRRLRVQREVVALCVVRPAGGRVHRVEAGVERILHGLGDGARPAVLDHIGSEAVGGRLLAEDAPGEIPAGFALLQPVMGHRGVAHHAVVGEHDAHVIEELAG
ncbi:MAG: hypothetical protein ACKVWR_14245 [Acidimicrobiales bacterium]